MSMFLSTICKRPSIIGWGVFAFAGCCVATFVIHNLVKHANAEYISYGLLYCALSTMCVYILAEKHQYKDMVEDVLPPKLVKSCAKKKMCAEKFEEVTILFCDIVGFTELSSQLPPMQVLTLLNDLYVKFDEFAAHRGVYKVETIGDAYMCVSGCPQHEDPVIAARKMVSMAKDILRFVYRYDGSGILPEAYTLQMRVGLHSGPVVAGVVGKTRLRYCLFGDTVNTASRMETNSKPMRIHISSQTAALLESPVGEKPIAVKRPSQSMMISWRSNSNSSVTSSSSTAGLEDLEEPVPISPRRNKIAVKGKGEMKTFWVCYNAQKDNSDTDSDAEEMDGERVRASRKLSYDAQAELSKQWSEQSLRDDIEALIREEEEAEEEEERNTSHQEDRQLTVFNPVFSSESSRTKEGGGGNKLSLRRSTSLPVLHKGLPNEESSNISIKETGKKKKPNMFTFSKVDCYEEMEYDLV